MGTHTSLFFAILEGIMKDNFKRKFWISISVVIGTIAASSVALYFLSIRIEEAANVIAATRTGTASQNAEFQDLANLKKNATAAATYQVVMDKLLASQEALITFPTQVDALGRADGVSTSFSFHGSPISASTSTPGNAVFSLDVSGPIDNLLSFLKDFESSAPILLSSLDTVSLTGDGSNYTLTAEGAVYFK